MQKCLKRGAYPSLTCMETLWYDKSSYIFVLVFRAGQKKKIYLLGLFLLRGFFLSFQRLLFEKKAYVHFSFRVPVCFYKWMVLVI